MGVNMQNISLSELLKHPEYKESKAVLPIIIGTDTNGKPFIQDLHKIPHLLIGGGAGTGKTMFLKAVIHNIQNRYSTKECEITVLNPKGIDFEKYVNSVTVINDVDECMQVLQNTVEEMDNRYTLLLKSKTKNITEYNQQNPENQLPFHIVLIDEISTMISFFGKKVEQNIIPLAEKARATGIHLIITYYYFDKISSLFKAYFPVRMAFWVATQKESVKILGEPGAEKLATQDEALFSDAGRIPILIHTPYIEE